ncbi:MAG: hypothetical protein H6Q10_1712 [Acidobacteria bacterium]|nr:hypothetical protein [Acidobacteriota bacterium]
MTARPVWRAGLVLAAAAVVAFDGCAARRLALPQGAGQGFPEFRAAFDEATGACRAVTSLTAEAGVSGRVGGQKLRGRVIAGFSRPDRLRLEGLAPFGPPAFILVSSGGEATLLLPRDPAVLRGEPPEAIIEALVGLPLSPATLQAVIAGCGLPVSDPVAGVSYGGGWARVEGGRGAATYLRQDDGGRWIVQAAVDGSLRVEYERRVEGAVREIRLSLEGDQPRTELRLKVTEVDLAVALGDEAFAVKVPRDAVAITLPELRRAGPLGR